MQSFIDHLVITAPGLTSGSEYVFQQLGVKPQPGGEHERMGTHNRLLKLGEELYLEVISVNPQSLPVGRPRWFELDSITDETKPKLSTWVIRTNDIYEAVKASPVSLGHIEPMSRGDLNWLITIPEDGVMPMNGMMPVLIQWETKTHPANRLTDNDCSLLQLEINHPDAKMIEQFLQSINFSGDVIVKKSNESKLAAQIKTKEAICSLH
jgi:hypothetical protein